MKRLFIIILTLVAVPGWAAELVKRLGTPFDEEAFWSPVLVQAAPGRLHGLINLELSNAYVTTHGLLVENQGVVFQPLLSLSADLYLRPAEFLSGVTATVGGWSSVHSRESGKQPGHWNEGDLFGGLTLAFARDWRLSAFYERYYSQTDSYPETAEVALTLSYDDTRALGLFALHPYVTLTPQVENKTSVTFRADKIHRSYEWRLGVTPAYQFQQIPLKLELPTFFTLVPNDYYQRSTLETRHLEIFGIDYPYQVYNGAGGGNGVGYFTTALRASVPLKFMPRQTGFWNVYAAVQYYRFVNAGLLDNNQVLGADAQRERNLVQFHAGLSISF